MWPLPGWWSPNERTKPTACRVRSACPGAVGGGGLPPLINPDGTRRTSVCSPEYAGDFCTDCAQNYFMDNGVCRSCGSDASAKAELTIVIFSLAAFICTIAWGLAMLSAKRVVLIVSTLVILQQMAMVSRVGLQELSDSDTSPVVGGIVRFAAIINFEIETVRPGCDIPAISFTGIYYGTLVLLLGSLVVFALAACAWRVIGRARKRSRDLVARSHLDLTTAASRELSSEWLTRARLIHAGLILGSLGYLQLAVRSLQAIHCIRSGDGKWRLSADLTLECYTGAHIPLAVIAWMIIVVFCGGFPLLGFVVAFRLSRRARAESIDREALMERVGVVIRGLRGSRLWFRTLQFGVSFAFAAETVLVREAGSRLLAAMLNFCLNIVLVAVLDPFLHLYHTVLANVIGLLSCGQILYFIHRENAHLFTIALAAVLSSLACTVGLAGWRFGRWQAGQGSNAVAPATDFDEAPQLIAELSTTVINLKPVDGESSSRDDVVDVDVDAVSDTLVTRTSGGLDAGESSPCSPCSRTEFRRAVARSARGSVSVAARVVASMVAERAETTTRAIPCVISWFFLRTTFSAVADSVSR